MLLYTFSMVKTGEILAIGINHLYALVAIREKLNAEKIAETISSRFFPHLFTEWIILSTCNRTEIYVVTSDPEKAEEVLRAFFPVKAHYFYKNSEAIRHLFSVAAGLDSMIVGESEILSQIRNTYKKAIIRKTIGPLLHQLLKDALRIGKNVRHTTQIGEGITSITQAAILLAKKRMGTLFNKMVLLIGAGEMAEHMLTSLIYQGITNVTVINRTHERAIVMTKKLGGIPVAFDELASLLARCDLVISATSSPGSIISAKLVQEAVKLRNSRLLCMIDLAVPRDIETQVSRVKGVQLYNIDDMQKLVNTTVARRRNAASRVLVNIGSGVDRYLYWRKLRKAAILLQSLTIASDAIREKELERALKKIPHANSHDKKVMAILAKRIEKKLLAKPIANLKHTMQSENSQVYLDVVKALYEL